MLSEDQDALDLQALLGKTQQLCFRPVLGHSSGAGRMCSLQAKDFPQTYIEKIFFPPTTASAKRC